MNQELTAEQKLELRRAKGRQKYHERKAYWKEYYQRNKAKFRERDKKWREANAEHFDAQQRTYREGRKDKQKIYRQSVKVKMRPWHKEWARKRREDPIFRLKQALRTRLTTALRLGGHKKHRGTVEILGCTPSFLMAYLQARFRDGMTWDNRGKIWHVDHIIPLSTAKTRKDVERLSHYTNLQPLLCFDNLSKGDKVMNQTMLDLGRAKGHFQKRRRQWRLAKTALRIFDPTGGLLPEDK